MVVANLIELISELPNTGVSHYTPPAFIPLCMEPLYPETGKKSVCSSRSTLRTDIAMLEHYAERLLPRLSNLELGNRCASWIYGLFHSCSPYLTTYINVVHLQTCCHLMYLAHNVASGTRYSQHTQNIKSTDTKAWADGDRGADMGAS